MNRYTNLLTYVCHLSVLYSSDSFSIPGNGVGSGGKLKGGGHGHGGHPEYGRNVFNYDFGGGFGDGRYCAYHLDQGNGRGFGPLGFVYGGGKSKKLKWKSI